MTLSLQRPSKILYQVIAHSMMNKRICNIKVLVDPIPEAISGSSYWNGSLPIAARDGRPRPYVRPGMIDDRSEACPDKVNTTWHLYNYVAVRPKPRTGGKSANLSYYDPRTAEKGFSTVHCRACFADYSYFTGFLLDEERTIVCCG